MYKLTLQLTLFESVSPQGTTQLPPSHKEYTLSQVYNISFKFRFNQKVHLNKTLFQIALKHRPVSC